MTSVQFSAMTFRVPASKTTDRRWAGESGTRGSRATVHGEAVLENLEEGVQVGPLEHQRRLDLEDVVRRAITGQHHPAIPCELDQFGDLRGGWHALARELDAEEEPRQF
jgi:hypothetical protein